MTNNGFLRGMTIGVLVGAAIGAAVMPKHKCEKKSTGKFLRTAGEIIDHITGMFC